MGLHSRRSRGVDAKFEPIRHASQRRQPRPLVAGFLWQLLGLAEQRVVLGVDIDYSAIAQNKAFLVVPIVFIESIIETVLE